MESVPSSGISLGGVLLIIAVGIFVYKYIVFMVRRNTLLIITRFGNIHSVKDSGFAFLFPLVESVEKVTWTINKQVYFEGYRIPKLMEWLLPLNIFINGLEYKFILTCYAEITDIYAFISSAPEPLERFYSDFFAIFNKHFQQKKFSWETYVSTLLEILQALEKEVTYGIKMTAINLLSYTDPPEIMETKKQAELASAASKILYAQEKDRLEHEIKIINLSKEKMIAENALRNLMIAQSKELVKKAAAAE